MHRSVAIAAVLTASVSIASPAFADTSTATTPNGASVALTVDNYTVQSRECQPLPVTATFNNVPAGDLYTVMQGKASIPGSNTYIYISAEVFKYESDAVTVYGQVCPSSDPLGTYSANMEFYSGTATVTGTPLTFTIEPAPTTMKVTSKRTGRGVSVTAVSTIATATGPVGVEGTYRLYTMTPKKLGGTGKWKYQFMFFPDSFGKGVSDTLTSIGKGSKIRVDLACEDYCTSASSTVSVR